MTEGLPTSAAGTPAARILVVEDEPTINQAVTDRLRAEGFAVDQAYDGPGAVAAFAQLLPGSRRAGRDAARLRRPRGLPPGPGDPARAGPHAHRPLRRDGHARRPRRRRRRLRDQAVLDARGRRAGPRAAAPRGARRGAGRAGGARIELAGLSIDPARGASPSAARGAPDAAGVRPALRAGRRAAGPCAPGRLLARGLGMVRRVRHAHPRQPRQVPARARSAATGCAPCTASATPWRPARERLRAPLDAVPSIKVKLGLLVGVSVVRGRARRRGRRRCGGPLVGQPARDGRRGPGRDPVAGPRDDLAAAGDDRRRPGDGRAATTASGSRATSPTRSGSSPVAFNAMAADLAAADQQRRRTGRDRLPRAAHAAHRLAGPPGEPRRRGREPDDEALRGGAAAGRAAQRAGRRPARPVAHRRRGGSADRHRGAGRRPPGRIGRRGRARRPPRPGERPDQPRRPRRPGRSRPAAPARGEPRSRTRSGTARRTARCWSAPAPWSRPPGGWRFATRGPASPPSRRSTCSSGSARAGTRPAAPDSGWPSPGGCASCTAARSPCCRTTAPRPGRCCGRPSRGCPSRTRPEHRAHRRPTLAAPH